MEKVKPGLKSPVVYIETAFCYDLTKLQTLNHPYSSSSYVMEDHSKRLIFKTRVTRIKQRKIKGNCRKTILNSFKTTQIWYQAINCTPKNRFMSNFLKLLKAFVALELTCDI